MQKVRGIISGHERQAIPLREWRRKQQKLRHGSRQIMCFWPVREAKGFGFLLPMPLIEV
jgi:hypothetical protein